MRSIPPLPTTYRIINPDYLQAEVRSAEAGLEIARRNLTQAQESLAKAEARLARVKGGTK